MWKKLNKKNNKGLGHLINITITYFLFLVLFALAIDLSFLAVKQITVTNYASDLANKLMVQGGFVGANKEHFDTSEANEFFYNWKSNEDIIETSKNNFSRVGISNDQWVMKLVSQETNNKGEPIGGKKETTIYDTGAMSLNKKHKVKFKDVATLEIIYYHNWFFSGGFLGLKNKGINIKVPFVSDYFESY